MIVKYVLSVKLQVDMHHIYTMSVNEFTLSINLSLACIIQTLEAQGPQTKYHILSAD